MRRSPCNAQASFRNSSAAGALRQLVSGDCHQTNDAASTFRTGRGGHDRNKNHGENLQMRKLLLIATLSLGTFGFALAQTTGRRFSRHGKLRFRRDRQHEPAARPARTAAPLRRNRTGNNPAPTITATTGAMGSPGIRPVQSTSGQLHEPGLDEQSGPRRRSQPRARHHRPTTSPEPSTSTPPPAGTSPTPGSTTPR